MNFITLIRKLIFLNLYFYAKHYVSAIKEHSSLVLTENYGAFQLTLPYKYDRDEKKMISYFKAPEEGNTNHFCPEIGKPVKRALDKIKTVDPLTETNDFHMCETSIEAVYARVTNVEKFKNNWNDNTVELKHSGFLLRTEGNSNDDASIETDPKYDEEWSSDYDLYVEMEVFRKKDPAETVAIKYILLSTDLPYYKQHFKLEEYVKNSGLKEAPKPFEYAYMNNYANFAFENKLNHKSIELLLNYRQTNKLHIMQFASIDHFQIPMWGLPTKIIDNLIPVWEKPKVKWDLVDKFAILVAKYLDDLRVIAGITGTMTISNEEVVDKFGYRYPKYFWKAFEYHGPSHVYGIIVILHYNSFEETKERICDEINVCEENSWQISNSDFRNGEIYCCNMTEENIRKLDANYLSLKERKPFNLNNWEEEKMKIFRDFIDVLKDIII